MSASRASAWMRICDGGLGRPAGVVPIQPYADAPDMSHQQFVDAIDRIVGICLRT